MSVKESPVGPLNDPSSYQSPKLFFSVFVCVNLHWSAFNSNVAETIFKAIFSLKQVEWKQGPEGTSDFLAFYEIFVKAAALC